MSDQPKPPTGEVRNCEICGEDALLVRCNGKFFVRVRRITKCRRRDKCKTDLRDTEREAIESWNKRILH